VGAELLPLTPAGDSTPISLYKAGFDVWIDGNRGTIYQRGHDNAEITQEEYWNFSSTEMALEDQPAQIEYILETTGKDSLAYVGYSMGTMQMIYALGMSQFDEQLLSTLNKVDSAHLITPCYFPTFFEGTEEERRAGALGLLELLRESEALYMGGEGSDVTLE
jgi:pimeloyl-ACP methyl ester carboxylesterase